MLLSWRRCCKVAHYIHAERCASILAAVPSEYKEDVRMQVRHQTCLDHQVILGTRPDLDPEIWFGHET